MDMPMFDLMGVLLLAASAATAVIALLVFRNSHRLRWLWFGASAVVFLLITRVMIGRLLPALVDVSPGLREGVGQALATLAAIAASFTADVAIRQFIWYGRLSDHGRPRVPNILIGLFSLAGYGLCALLIASLILGQDVTAVAATSGVVAIVLGVSAQQTLGQVFAGLALNLSRPFRVGDSLQVDGVWGVVVDADWRAVTLRTYEGTLVTLPNTLISAARLTNLDAPTHDLRHHIPFVIDIDVPPGKVRAVALETLSGLEHVLPSPAPLLLFKNFDERGVLYEAIFWHRDPNFYILRRDEVGQALWYAFNRAGIGISVNRRLLAAPSDVAQPPVDNPLAKLSYLLRRSALFAGLPVSDLDSLAARGQARQFAAGERIMREGDTGATMFLIIEGRVSVQLALPDGTDARIYDLGLGEIFGHMSALTGARRFATVRADTAVTLAEFDKESLAQLVADNPDVVDLVAGEIMRLEAAEQQLRPASAQAARIEVPAPHPHLLGRMADRIRAFLVDARPG
jgi:branched-chain amino acid transport system substrate-binding protein